MLSFARRVIEAAEHADWTQVVQNGGPPCFRLEDDGRFCLRAERWEGHREPDVGEDELYHRFVSLADLLWLRPMRRVR